MSENEIKVIRTAQIVAAEINCIKEQARQMFVGACVEIGRRLIEAKRLVPHGEWSAWLEKNIDYSDRTAQRMMKLAEEYNGKTAALSDISMTQALSLATLTEEQRGEFTAKNNVAGMSTRELDDKIERYRLDADAAKREAERARDERDAANKNLTAAQGIITQAEAAARENRDKLREAEKRREEIEQQLREAPVEAMMPEVYQAEMDSLRQQLQAAQQKKDTESAKLILLRESYQQFTTVYKTLRGRLTDAEGENAETASPYRAAILRAVEMMAEQLGGEGEKT